MSAASVIIRRRKRLIHRFHQAGALSQENVITLDSIERSNWIFQQMVRHGVFLETKPGHYYMDELKALKFMRQRRKRALIFCGAFLFIWLLLWCISRLF